MIYREARGGELGTVVSRVCRCLLESRNSPSQPLTNRIKSIASKPKVARRHDDLHGVYVLSKIDPRGAKHKTRNRKFRKSALPLLAATNVPSGPSDVVSHGGTRVTPDTSATCSIVPSLLLHKRYQLRRSTSESSSHWAECSQAFVSLRSSRRRASAPTVNADGIPRDRTFLSTSAVKCTVVQCRVGGTKGRRLVPWFSANIASYCIYHNRYLHMCLQNHA